MNHLTCRCALLACLITLSGCINDNSSGPIREGDGLGDEETVVSGGADETAGAERAGDVMSGVAGELAGDDPSEDAGAPAGEEEMTGSAGEITMSVDMMPPPDPPPAPESLPACQRFCQRTEDCLYAQCEELRQFPVDQFCRGWCRVSTEEWLNQSAEMACDDFSRRIYGFSPEIRTICEADPEVDSCEAICDFGEICGVVSANCRANCNQSSSEAQLCFRAAADQEDCIRFLQCYEQPQEPPRGRDSEELCGRVCEREGSCISNACAPGTWSRDQVTDCFETCVDQRPRREEIFERFQSTCEEVVAEALAADAQVAARCEVAEEDVCSTFCSDRIVGCDVIDQTTCETTCATWDEANFICLQNAGSCDEIESCLIEPDEQERCRRSCDHFQTCLEEACPPRIIPPNLTDSCTADCFADPISAEELASWEATECREVRETVYDGNPGLRRSCEGNQDFRPTPEECSDFCDNGLDECIIGGPTICLSACASMDREQYACALQARGECTQIDLCLTD